MVTVPVLEMVLETKMPEKLSPASSSFFLVIVGADLSLGLHEPSLFRFSGYDANAASDKC
jgi:hypothetical protein